MNHRSGQHPFPHAAKHEPGEDSPAWLSWSGMFVGPLAAAALYLALPAQSHDAAGAVVSGLSDPARANAALAATMSAEMKVFLEQLDYAGGRPQLPGYDSLELITGPYLYSALDGSLPIDEALKKACRETESDLLRKMVP